MWKKERVFFFGQTMKRKKKKKSTSEAQKAKSPTGEEELPVWSSAPFLLTAPSAPPQEGDGESKRFDDGKCGVATPLSQLENGKFSRLRAQLCMKL